MNLKTVPMLRGLLLVLALLTFLCACTGKEASSTTSGFYTDESSAATVETTVATEAATQITEPLMPLETEPEATFAPYTVRIFYGTLPVHAEPTYEKPAIGIVEAAGVYTIVEEFEDPQGNLWGKLKSGAGWVDLTRNAKDGEGDFLICNAGEPTPGSYYSCKAATSQYAYPVAIRAQVPMYNVSFFAIDAVDAYIRGTEFIRIPSMAAGEYLVAWVEFPGSASMYGLECTDSQGNTQIYCVTESGLDGSVHISPLTVPLLEQP